MTAPDLTALAGRTDVLLAGLAVTVLALAWISHRVRKVAKSERPDDTLANVAMVVGLGWSAEAVWEITGPGEMDLPLQVRLLLFFVFETLLLLSMIRAKRAMRELGFPGRSGRTAWIIAASMATVGAAAGDSFGDSLVRFLIPLLITLAWWDGLVGESAKRREGATSWRWTPRRLLLAVGAIEPGERDVETVNRERLTQQMTRLEFVRRHGAEWRRKLAARKLARMSLTADDDMISAVRQRVDRATWFEPTQDDAVQTASQRSISVGSAASARARRVRHGKALRKVHVTHPRPVIVAAQKPREEDRETQEIDTVVRVIRDTFPKSPLRQIARLAVTSEPTVRRALRRTQNPAPPPSTNGRKPELTGADR